MHPPISEAVEAGAAAVLAGLVGDGEALELRREAVEALNLIATAGDFDDMMMRLKSSDPSSQHAATIQLRTLLSGRNPPTQQVIEAQVIPQFVAFLRQRDDDQILQVRDDLRTSV
jgi:hypothetical protein